MSALGIRKPHIYGVTIHQRMNRPYNGECVIQHVEFEAQTVTGYLMVKPGILNWMLAKLTGPIRFDVLIQVGRFAPLGPVDSSMLMTPYAPFALIPQPVLMRNQDIKITVAPKHTRRWLQWLAPAYDGQLCFTGTAVWNV